MKIAPQQFDENGAPLVGGMMFFSKQAFADKNLTIPLGIPVVLDNHGLVPPLYFNPRACCGRAQTQSPASAQSRTVPRRKSL